MDEMIRKIELTIESKNKNQKKDENRNKIPIVVLSNHLQSLQNLMYVIGDHLDGNSPRIRGDFPKSVKEKCELVIEDIKSGSVIANIGLANTQRSLSEGTHGEKALNIAKQVIEIAETEDDIASMILGIIPDDNRAFRSIREINSIWPSEGSDYKVSIGFGKKDSIQLDPKRKPYLERALSKPTNPEEKQYIGRLIQIRVDRKRQFIIETPKGIKTCIYSPNIEEDTIKNLKKLIKVSGIENKNGYIEISDERSINSVESLPLDEIKIEGALKKFKLPLELEVEFENEHYIISNDDLGLLVVSDNLKKGIEGIKEEFNTLWDYYVNDTPDNLTTSAIEFRNRLFSLIEEEEL